MSVSVIIPFYNRAAVLGNAVRSVLSQTFNDFELILVDDGSTDDSQDRLSGYDDPRIKIIKHDVNKGAAAARNSGVRAASGEWIAFLDSDDTWLPDKLERHLSFMNEKNAVASCTSFALIMPDGRRVVRHLSPEKDWKREFYTGCKVSPGSTLLVKREVFDDVGLLDVSLKRFEDWDWLLRLVRKYDFHAFDAVLSEIYPGICSDMGVVSQSLDLLSAKHAGHLKEEDDGVYRIFKSSLALEKGYAAYHAGKRLQALKYVVLACLLSPIRAGQFVTRLSQKVIRRN